MNTKITRISGISQKQEFQEKKIYSKGVSGFGNDGKINFSDDESRRFSDIPTIEINNANIRIIENCHIFDSGSVENVDIDICQGIEVSYCFIGQKEATPQKKYRHIKIGKNSTFTGTSILIDIVDLEIITEICGDNTTSKLDILALAIDNTQISAQGIVRVLAPYRHVSTRVDQTNILIGTGARVRGIPKLEICTEDIEGGHSCRVHKLGGEALFYLTSRGLTEHNAEVLLLNSEIRRHLRTLDTSNMERICYDIHMRIRK